MKKAGPSGWRGVMNRRPQPSDFGLSPLADNVDSLTQRDLHKPRPSRLQHGIGGGMRFTEGYERSGLIPADFSRSIFDRQLSLTGPRVLVGLYCTALMTILMVSHIHLRFHIHDMKMQEHSLQSVQQQLERRISFLDRGVASRLGDLAPMRDVAVNHLNMVRTGRASELVIAPHIAQKYSPEAIAAVTEKNSQSVAAPAEEPALNPFFRFADFAMAFIPSDK